MHIILTDEQGSIVIGLGFWAILTLTIYGWLYLFDRIYKRDYYDNNFYKLKRTKYFFSYYEIKTGEITKHIFWLNLIAHVIVLSSLYSLIAYELYPNQINGILRVILTYLGLTSLWLTIGAFCQIYKLKLEKKRKKY